MRQTPEPATLPSDRRLRLVRRLAAVCVLLMMATLLLSAYMRLSQAGLGCADWPACYGQSLRDALQGKAAAAAGASVALARLAHRGVAFLVLVLVMVMVAATLLTRPVLRREGQLCAALLALALGLAVLGLMTPGATQPVVTLGNLLGGFLMLSLCVRLAAPVSDPPGPAFHISTLARVAALVLLLQIGLGATISGSFAALSCSGWADCSSRLQADGWSAQVLSPWPTPQLESVPPFNRGGALLHLAHRVGAVLLLSLVAALGLALLRRGRRAEGVLLIVLPLLQAALGLAFTGAGLPIAGVLLHNLMAATLLALLLRRL